MKLHSKHQLRVKRERRLRNALSQVTRTLTPEQKAQIPAAASIRSQSLRALKAVNKTRVIKQHMTELAINGSL